MAHVITEVDAFTASITVPDGGDARSDAAEVVADIAQRLANRTKNLLRLDGEKAVLASPNTFAATQTMSIDLSVGRDTSSGRDITATRDVIAGRHLVAANNAKVTGDYFYTSPKSRTSLVSLNTGVIMNIAAGLSLTHTTVLGADGIVSCPSWASGQLVAWRILIPNTSVITGIDVIHNTSTAAPNQFDLLKRSGAVFDPIGAGTTLPALSSLLSAPVSGPSSAGLSTALLVPASTLTVDNAANEYWVTWVSTGLHTADYIGAIQILWNDNGPRTDHS